MGIAVVVLVIVLVVITGVSWMASGKALTDLEVHKEEVNIAFRKIAVLSQRVETLEKSLEESLRSGVDVV